MSNIEWNVHNPFYIHPSENLNQMLTDENYHTWCREVKRTLGSKNKLCFILDNTGIERPKPGDKLYDAWGHANNSHYLAC